VKFFALHDDVPRLKCVGAKLSPSADPKQKTFFPFACLIAVPFGRGLGDGRVNHHAVSLPPAGPSLKPRPSTEVVDVVARRKFTWGSFECHLEFTELHHPAFNAVV